MTDVEGALIALLLSDQAPCGRPSVRSMREILNGIFYVLPALAGHVSRKMMEHYSHIRRKAKEAAIEGSTVLISHPKFLRGGNKIGHSQSGMGM